MTIQLYSGTTIFFILSGLVLCVIITWTIATGRVKPYQEKYQTLLNSELYAEVHEIAEQLGGMDQFKSKFLAWRASDHDLLQAEVERLREKNQLKSSFMAGMSHELRTPLNSIIGYTELMLMGISEIDPDTLEDVQAIHDNGRSLLQTISTIVDLSKIEVGRIELNLEKVYIEPLLDKLVTSNARLLGHKPIKMLLEVDEDLPSIEADRMRITQIVNNLVSHAIKFTEAGNITLRACTDDPGWIRLEVQDTGVGIDEADLQEIFEQYKQVGDGVAHAKGADLGLVTARHFAQMHGGTLDICNRSDQGTIATVRLPVQHHATKEQIQ